MREESKVGVGDGVWRRDGAPWRPTRPWVGALGLDPGDRRDELLRVAAEARSLPLDVVAVEAPAPEPAAALDLLARAAAVHPPRGLLLGESWQEAAAARCRSLTGAAADLGLVDALRTEDPGDWLGHHLEGGALEAFLAQVWPEAAGPPARAVVLGSTPMALVAGLVAARRETESVVFVDADAARRESLVARLEGSVNWPDQATWQVAGVPPTEAAAAAGGLFLRAVPTPVPDADWLPDVAGDAPCLLVDLRGCTATAPLGFAHPAAGGIQVMAAGLAAAWYLGPPVPWDALTSAPPS